MWEEQSLEALWESFARQVLDPKRVTPESTQYTETRRAFYAGAQGMLGMTSQLAILYSEEEAMQKLDAITGEFEAFADALRNGQASLIRKDT